MKEGRGRLEGITQETAKGQTRSWQALLPDLERGSVGLCLERRERTSQEVEVGLRLDRVADDHHDDRQLGARPG